MTRPDARRFGAAIFDMDGVLIDSERVIVDAYVAASADCGHPITAADFLPVVGLSGPAARDALVELFGGADRLARVGERAAVLMRGDHPAPVFPAKPGAHDLLAAITARRVPLAVASSTRRREVLRRLSAVGLDGHFAAVAGGDEVTRGKPDPSIYLLAASRLGMDPRQCIAFEDSDHGAAAAHAAGMRVVVVPDLKAPTEAVLAQAFLVMPSLLQAMPHLDHWFAAGD